MGREKVSARVHSMEFLYDRSITPDRAALVLMGETPRRHEL